MLPTQNLRSAYYNPSPIKVRSPPRVQKMQRQSDDNELNKIM